MAFNLPYELKYFNVWRIHANKFIQAIDSFTVTVYKDGELYTGLLYDENEKQLSNPFGATGKSSFYVAVEDGSNYTLEAVSNGAKFWRKDTQFLYVAGALQNIEQLAEEAQQAAADSADSANESAESAIVSEMAEQSAAAYAELAMEYPREIAESVINDYGINFISDNRFLFGVTDSPGYGSWLFADIFDGGVPVFSANAMADVLQDLGKIGFTFNTDEDIFASLVDRVGNPTWITSTLDGMPPAWVYSLFREELKILDLEVNYPYLFSLTDLNGDATVLTIGADGRFADFAIEALKEDLGIEGELGSIKSSDHYVSSDGSVFKMVTDMTRISGWGSSTIDGLVTYFTAMAVAFGATYQNGGKGGEVSNQICARLGSRPALLTFPSDEIPASGSVNITSSNMTANASLLSYTGSINGVSGTLSVTGGNQLVFTRSGSGSTVPVDPDTPFIPTIGSQYRDAVLILNIGKNDFSASISGREVQVIERTAGAFDYASPFTKRVIVMGHFADTNTPEVSMERDQILLTNAAYSDRYGVLYLDMYGYLTGPQVWIDTGITPTPDDLAQQSIGNKPPSLSADAQHLNAAGRAAVTNFLVIPKMIELGWYKLS